MMSMSSASSSLICATCPDVYGLKKNFLQQVIIFVEHALGYLHVALEGGAGASWCFITAAKAKVLTKGILSE